MDPVTHALAGAAVGAVAGRWLRLPPGDGNAAAPGRATSRVSVRMLMLAGAVAGVLPDVDRLIHSESDPLLHIEYHRHFTHALTFVPVGGLVAALPWVVQRSRRAHGLTYVAACSLAYATHGVIDAATSYGTLLFWPFSFERVAWNWISIVDPAFTLLLLAGVAASWWQTRRSMQGSGLVPLVVALLLCGAYLGVGARQRGRALDALQVIAAGRGHAPLRVEVMPGFLNHIVWRSLYEDAGTLYMDRIRVPWAGNVAWSPGVSVPAIRPNELPAGELVSTRLRADVERFHWLSRGWVARHPADPTVLGDARYSLETDRFEPVWGIRVRRGKEQPVEWVDGSRTRRVSVRRLLTEILGRDPSYRAVP